MAATDTARLRRDRPLRLRAGERVRVRPAAEILETLDAHGVVNGLPFMPEMLEYCGRELRVFKSAHKTCDTAKQTCKMQQPATPRTRSSGDLRAGHTRGLEALPLPLSR